MPNLDQLTEVGWTDDDLQHWSFSHMAEHRDVNRVILQTQGKRIDEYVLDPFDGTSRALYWHQSMHDQVNKALGFQGYDLLDVDWNDEEAVIQWMNYNASEHDQWKMVLNL